MSDPIVPDTPVIQQNRARGVVWPRDLKREVWAMTDGRCFYCGLHTNPFATFTIDHIYPRSRGGTDDVPNLVPACDRCNNAKGTRLLDEWHPKRPFWFLSDEYAARYGVRRAVVIDEWIGELSCVEDTPDE